MGEETQEAVTVRVFTDVAWDAREAAKGGTLTELQLKTLLAAATEVANAARRALVAQYGTRTLVR